MNTTPMPSVNLWLKKACGSSVTKRVYLSQFRRFLRYYQINPDELVREWKQIRYDYLKRHQFMDKWTENIEDFYANLEGAPLTRIAYITSVISFFKHHRIPLEVEINKKTAHVAYHNKDIKKEEIRRIIDHCSLRAKVFFLMIAESGLRPHTLVQLRYGMIREDFEANRIPLRIDLPAQLLKDRVGHRFSFIGEDGFKALKEYLTPRLPLKDEDHIFTREKGGRKASGRENMGMASFSNIFSRTVLKLGLAKPSNGKPKPLRLYCLRKYFRNAIRVSDTSFREFWMGHTFGTDEHYLTRDPERHREEYAKAYPSIRIYEPSVSQSIEELTEFYEKRSEEQQEEINRLRERLKELRETVVEVQPLVEFVNSFDTPEELKQILHFLRDDLINQYSDEKIRPTKAEFSPYIKDKLNRIAKRKGITPKEALEQLIQEDLEVMEEDKKDGRN